MNATIESTEVTNRCPLCGEPLTENAQECTNCDWVPGYQQEENVRNRYDRRDVAAATISIVPGAGHILKGHMKEGLLLLLAGVPIVLVFAFAFTMFFGWLLVPTYWIGVAMDAYYRPDLRGLGGMPPETRQAEVASRRA